MLVIVVVAEDGGEFRAVQSRGAARRMNVKVNEQQVQRYILRCEQSIGPQIQDKIYHFSILLFESILRIARIRHTSTTYS